MAMATVLRVFERAARRIERCVRMNQAGQMCQTFWPGDMLAGMVPHGSRGERYSEPFLGAMPSVGAKGYE